MKKSINFLSIGVFFLALMFVSSTQAQVSVNGKNCLGTWKTVDDETGRTKSHVQIFKEGNKYHAKIVKLLDPQTLKDSGKKTFEEVTCTKCPSAHGKGTKMLGLKMLWDMEEDGDKWGDGKIMDPKKGKIYGCTMWLDDADKKGDTLKVRGWVAFIFRTQTWYRIN